MNSGELRCSGVCTFVLIMNNAEILVIRLETTSNLLANQLIGHVGRSQGYNTSACEETIYVTLGHDLY